MVIDWNAFTPASAAAGGALIGLAAAMLLLWNGRVAGVSGIAAGLLRPSQGDFAWRAAFLLGLVAAPAVYALVHNLPPIAFETSMPVLALSGLLVGIGTRIGSGCTSGHGICGIARLSPRSIVSTLCFVGAGMVTVFLVRHVLRTAA